MGQNQKEETQARSAVETEHVGCEERGSERGLKKCVHLESAHPLQEAEARSVTLSRATSTAVKGHHSVQTRTHTWTESGVFTCAQMGTIPYVGPALTSLCCRANKFRQRYECSGPEGTNIGEK